MQRHISILPQVSFYHACMHASMHPSIHPSSIHAKTLSPLCEPCIENTEIN